MSHGLYGRFSAWVDDLTLMACTLLERERGFARTPAGRPPEFRDLLQELRPAPPLLRWPQREPAPGERARITVEAPTVGASAWFDWHRSTSARPDTLVVYHHGLGEFPHDAIPRGLARTSGLRERCDFVVAKGFHHETFAHVSARLTSDRDHFIRCLAASAAMVRAVAKWGEERYRHRVMCGVSMGGVISLLEASHEPRFDLYVPFVAGPDLIDVITRSGFARLIQRRALRKARQEGWGRHLDLAALLADCPGPPIRPILARSDRLFRHEAQLRAYARVPRARVSSFAGGHITGAANLAVLGRHLRGAIESELWSEALAPA